MAATIKRGKLVIDRSAIKMSIEEEAAVRAFRAVKRMRAMLPSLNAFARAITRNPKVTVQIGPNPCTNGKIIWMRPPVRLGDVIGHDRANCGRRNDESAQICPACAQREEVQATLYHEMAHIVFDSFESVRESDRAELIDKAVEERRQAWIAEAVRKGTDTGASRYEKLKRQIDAATSRGGELSYWHVAPMISPYLHPIVNALEDARVNRAMYGVRAGTYHMFRAQALDVFTNGIQLPGGVIQRWDEAGENAQIIIGLYCMASGFDYKGWFTPAVETALGDPALTRAVARCATARTTASVYRAAFPILEDLRRWGCCKRCDDVEDDPPPPPPAPESKDKCDAPASDESGNPSDADDADNSDTGDGDESSTDDGEGDGARGEDTDDPGTGATGADDDTDDDPGADDTDDPGTGADDDPATDTDDMTDDTAPDVDGTAPDVDDDTCPDCGELEDECLCDPDDEEDDEDAPSESHGAGESKDSGAAEDTDDDWSDGDEDGDDETGEGGSPSSSMVPEGGEHRLDESIEEATRLLTKFGGHDDPDMTPDEKAVEREMERAVNQEENFDEATRTMFGVNVKRWDEADAWGDYEKDYSAAIEELSPDESLLGRTLVAARIAFAKNKKGKREVGHRRGRIVSHHLPSVLTGNDKVFSRAIKPGKRDYFMAITLDISGSTGYTRIRRIKSLGMAMGDLCHRLGIKFVMYAHTGHATKDSLYDLDIYVIKDENEAWDTKAKTALAALTARSANLDGHSLEFLRKRCDRSTATDKVILYVTDGAMPAENPHDELHVLQREIKTCAKRGYVLLAAGIDNDDPIEHGLETVRLDSDDDLPHLIKAIQEKLGA